MSRIGKKLIEIPQGVTVEINEKEITVKGPKGELKQIIHPEIKIEQKDGKIFVSPRHAEARSVGGPKTEDSQKGLLSHKATARRSRGLWGLYRALVWNMVEGVSKGFEKKLEIEGVGFKATLEGDGLTLNLGFTNPVKIKKPEGITFLVEKNVITVSGPNKALVGEISALIRKQKKAEPYKGKGIKYQGEKIRRKEGKKVVASK